MQFPPILIINLKERTDRWNQLSSHLDSLGLSYERVEAVKMDPGWKGTSASFKKCYRLAKQRNYPWVVIMEDDCVFQKHGKERFEQLLPLLWQRRLEWDVFNGGSVHITKACRIMQKPPLFQMKSWSAHFILAQNDSYDKLISMLEKGHCPDCFMRSRLRSWATYPHIAIQQKGYSNISKIMKDTRKNFRITDKILSKILHMRKRCSTRKQVKRIANAEKQKK
jgi:hypothetical protein